MNYLARHGTKRGRWQAIVTLIAALASLYIVLGPAFAAGGGIHDSGVQELDSSIDFTSNTVSYNSTSHDTVTPTLTSTPSGPPWDWNSLFTAAGVDSAGNADGSITTTAAFCQPGGACPGLVSDVGLPFNGTLFTRGSKDLSDPTTWSCTQQSSPPKDQLVNAYGAAWIAPATVGGITQNDTLVFLGLERPATNGNANAGFWLFKQTVLCDLATGSFTGTHSNGDLFIEGSFLSGGTSAVLTLTPWVCTPTSATDPTCSPAGSGALGTATTGSLNCPALTTTTDVFCEAVNQKTDPTTGAITNWDVHTPWSNIATGGTGSGDIPGPGFLEMGIDLSKALATASFAPCFASFLTDTRSAGSSTNAATKNFINGKFATCGSAKVHKYIDTNLNGAYDAASDITNTGIPAFPMTVANSTGKVLCSGTTGSDGNLACGSSLNNLPAGTYTVTETQLPGFYNTDPGTGTTCGDTAQTPPPPLPNSTDVNRSSTVACTFQVSSGTNPTVQIGNQCLAGVTFTVTGVPVNTTGVVASYTVTSGIDKGVSGTVALSPTPAGSTTYQGTSSHQFIQNDVLNWNFYVNNDATHTEPGATGVTFTGDVFNAHGNGIADCGSTSTGVFAPSSIEGFKFKDVTGTGFAANGSVPPGDTPLSGVTFELVSGTVLAGTATSGANGAFTFSNVNPGTYTVTETVPAGWIQTGPTSPFNYTVTVHLGDGTVTTDTGGKTLNFLDTPTYKFSVTFNSLANLPGTTTPATHGAITCTPGTGSSGSGTGTYASGTQQGASQTYSCSIGVTDP